MGTPLVGNILSCTQCLVMGCVSTITPLDHNPSHHHNNNHNNNQNNKHGHGSNHNKNNNNINKHHLNNNHNHHNYSPPSRSYRFHTDLPSLLQRLIFLSSDLSYLVLRQFRSFLLPSDTRYCTSTSGCFCNLLTTLSTPFSHNTLTYTHSLTHPLTYSHPLSHYAHIAFYLYFSHHFPPSFSLFLLPILYSCPLFHQQHLSAHTSS